MQKTKLWLFIIVALLCRLTASAHDFEVDGIYYNIISDAEVEVTYGGDIPPYVSVSNAYSGRFSNLSIPETITNDGKTFHVVSVGGYAFACCYSLTSVVIPEGVTSIEDEAFANCGSLTSITIPESVTTIGEGVFRDTQWYENQPDGIIYVNKVLLTYKGTMPENTTIEVKEGTVTICAKAFYGCEGLTSISIPESVISIGREAFLGTAWYRNQADGMIYAGRVAYEYKGAWDMPENTTIEIKEGIVSISSDAFFGGIGLVSVTIPESVVQIGANAFQGCTTLSSINLPRNLTMIGEHVFDGCCSLVSVVIPDGISKIEDRMFRDCSRLTSLILPVSVTSIGDQAFEGCSSLTDITIPVSVTSIGNQVFGGCSSLITVHISSLETWCNIDFYSPSSNPLNYAKNLYLNDESVTELTIPDGITSIKDYAFYNYNSLTSIILPKGLTSIGYDAFYGCNSLKTVLNFSGLDIQKGSWDNGYVAYYADRVINVDKLIDDYAFKTKDGVHYLTGYIGDDTELTLPTDYQGEIYQIGESAFAYCSSLTSVTIHEDVTSIGEYAFYNCSNLTAITIPEGVESIEDQAFYNCSSLTSIAIPEKVTSIQRYTFSGCSKLKELTLGKGLKKIDEGSFFSSTELEKITIYTSQPPRTEGYIFSDKVYESATLYVPQGSISKYQVMAGWSGFYNISEIEGGTPDYLTIRQADNGEVGIAIDLGRTYRVRIAASEGWKVHSVTFDGVDMTAQLDEGDTFTTPTLNGSAVLNVAYEQVGDVDNVASAERNAVKVRGYQGDLFISGTETGDHIVIYTVEGVALAEVEAEGEEVQLSLPQSQLYIVKAAGKVVKIQL